MKHGVGGIGRGGYFDSFVIDNRILLFFLSCSHQIRLATIA